MTTNKLPLTIGYLRDSLRGNRLEDVSKREAVEYLLEEYDFLMRRYREVVMPREFTVVKSDQETTT